MSIRIVITGLGVVAPNGVGTKAFTEAIKNGVSGVAHFKELEALEFSCQIAAEPEISEEKKLAYMSPLQPVSYTHLTLPTKRIV